MSPLAKAGWFSGKPPNDLVVREGRLTPCPETPNCVGSQDAGDSAIAPIVYRGEPDIAWRRLVVAASALPRIRVIRQDPHYLRIEATSRVFGFVDDVEFLHDPDKHVIHVRSASRVGYGDLGVNRKRIEQIRAHFNRISVSDGKW